MDAPVVTGDRLALIAGSSFDAASVLELGATIENVTTDYGTVALIDAGSLVILRRHHATSDEFCPAHLVDHHRSIAALCSLGCDRVLALGSVGSLRKWPVGTVIAPFDFYAPTVHPSFFTDRRGHSIPGFDEAWRDRIIETWNHVVDTPLIDGGVYAQTPGPRFETPAEVRALAAQADIVGMTIAGEAILAREAGLAYAPICVVDNLANGLSDVPLTIDEFHAGVARNRARLLADLEVLLPHLVSP